MTHEIGDEVRCGACRKVCPEEDLYVFTGKRMCEVCVAKAGLFPLGHTGARRDKISEKCRRLALSRHGH